MPVRETALRAARLLLLASLAASAPLSLFARGRPGVALSCALALLAATLLPRLFARAGLQVEGALWIVWLLPFTSAWGLGEGFALFARVHWWDHVPHTLGGAMACALFVRWARPRLRARPVELLGLGALVALAVGAVWEIGEFASDTLLHTATQSGNTDTMLDLVFDAAGGGMAALASGVLPVLRALGGRLWPARLHSAGKGA